MNDVTRCNEYHELNVLKKAYHEYDCLKTRLGLASQQKIWSKKEMRLGEEKTSLLLVWKGNQFVMLNCEKEFVPFS